jgi:acyl transferase domain-containing protein
LTVLAGETEAILALQNQLWEQQIACRVLDTTHAFHSHMMQDAVAEVTQLARSFSYAYPEIPYLSNVTGTWITAKQATDPEYWARHMCQPVQCFTMLSQLLSDDQMYHLIEVGPGQSLGSFVKQHPQCRREQYPFIYPTLRYSYDHHDDHWFLLSTIRKLWLTGVDLQWDALSPGYSDALTQERPFTFSPTSIKTPSTTLQKDRGEKRRQNQLQRRRSDSNRRTSN